MKRKKEINPINVAFLDLLSGALGAVIILFIVIPKAKSPQKVNVKEPVAKTKTKEDDSLVKKLFKKSIDAEAKLKVAIMTEDKIKEENQKMKMVIRGLKEAQAEAKDKLKFAQEELDKMIKKENAKVKSKQERVISSSPGVPVDVGFKFKGKNIVFIIDVSGSMHSEDRIGQVKAGLKMLITSMGEDFKINIIHFPGINAPFSVMWQYMRPISPDNKKLAYNFLQNLVPHGSTPTFQALFYTLDRYKDASDIVLLSDGAPTDRNKIPKLRNYNTVYDAIKYHNYNRIQINTIGVGSDFLKDKNNDRYKFLSKVAGTNDGFFVGF